MLSFAQTRSPMQDKGSVKHKCRSNQSWSMPYCYKSRAQIENQATELAAADFELFEGQYWSNFLRDKYTPKLDYPLLRWR